MAEDKKIEEQKELTEEELKKVDGGLSTAPEIYCPRCKKRVGLDDWVCPYCGQRL